MRFPNQYVFVLYIAAIHLVTPQQGFAATGHTPPTKQQKVGLVLSGGGALGLAHIGILQVLDELRVPVDCVVGTSMGALVGGAYATGVSPDQMEQTILATDLFTLFDDNPPRSELSQQLKRDDYSSLFDFTLGFNDWQIQLPAGASAGYKFELFLKEMMGQSAALTDLNFDDLPTPFRAIATDLENGSMVVFGRGELSRIMRASMSLPAVIAPAEVNGRVYIDGGLSRNLPIDIGRELCGDVLIAVNLGTKPKTRDQIQNSIDVALQSIVILTEQNVVESIKQLTPNDILIEPELDEFDSTSFSSQREIIERGVTAARKKLAALKRLSVSPEEYQAWQTERQRKIPPTVTPGAISVKTSGVITEAAVLRDINTGSGENYDPKQLHDDIIDIFGRGDFSYIGYSIVTDDQDATAVINAESKPWGPGYLKLGLGAATDFIGPSKIGVSASYRRTWINSLGAEWRSDMQIGYNSFLKTAFTQPLQVRDGAFITPYIEGHRGFVQFYEKNLRLGDIQVKRVQAGLNMGVTGTIGELQFGPYINNTSTEPDFGLITPILPNQRARQVGVELTAIYDQLDSIVFPRSGMFASLNIQTTKQSWNADDEYTRAQVTLSGATSIGKQTLSANLEWGDELSGLNDLPVYASFQLGGPKRLSGLYLDQLTGSHYNLATLSIYRQYSSLPSQLGRGLYLGVSMEAGKINDQFMEKPSDWVQAGSVYWGADTVLGVAYIGYGRTSLDQSAFYLTIGQHF